MKGMDEFLSVFGDITVLQVTQVIMACVFLVFAYRQLRDYLIKKHDKEQEKDEEIKEALQGVRAYPKYRQQSLDIQNSLNTRINNLENQIQTLCTMQEENTNQLKKIQEEDARRERNQLRDRLLQMCRYYTSRESKSWTKNESIVFWTLFKDYEGAGGDEFIHTDVEPKMLMLKIVDDESLV